MEYRNTKFWHIWRGFESIRSEIFKLENSEYFAFENEEEYAFIRDWFWFINLSTLFSYAPCSQGWFFATRLTITRLLEVMLYSHFCK